MSFFVRHTRKIVCVARNYHEHIKELGNDVPEKPFFFLKPASSLLPSPGPILLPVHTGGVTDCHHEVELALVIKRLCSNVSEVEAMDYVKGYALAIDVTDRTLQNLAKKQGRPWTESKGYDTFCPISEFIDFNRIPDPQNVQLILEVNGLVRQSDATNLMIWNLKQLISAASAIMTLEENDIILTGTPKGVGPIKPGDLVTASIPSANVSMSFDVGTRAKY